METQKQSHCPSTLNMETLNLINKMANPIIHCHCNICQDIAYNTDTEIDEDEDTMPVKVKQIRKDFKKFTEKIRKAPYDPQLWNERATWFLEGHKDEDDEKNRWPFLAAADALKVFWWFCCSQFREDNGLYPIPEVEQQKMKFDARRILVKALLDLGDSAEAKKYYHPEFTPLADKDEIKLDFPGYCKPAMITRRYQWIPSYFLHRDNFLHKIKHDLRSHGLDLRPSTIGPPSPKNLGVFAKKRFEQGDILFREPVLRANSPSKKNVVDTHFYDAAIRDLEKGTRRHPLSYSSIGALTASYNEIKESFEFYGDVVVHLQYLKDKDPMLLFNLDFDMWVLHTIQRRCSVNVFGFDENDEDGRCTEWSVISPMASLFQHSCEPSAVWTNEGNEVDFMIVKADRNIEAGEEIYDSYCLLNKNLDWRRKTLRHWIGCDCGCTRCLREEREKAAIIVGDVDSGVDMNDSATTSSGTASSSETDASSGE